MSHILGEDPRDNPVILGEPIIVDILRFDPETDIEPHLQRYVVPYRRRMSVFTLLREIYECQDGTLAFRNQQCGRGICGTCRCTIEMDGETRKNVKSCTIPLEPGKHIVIRPANGKIIRDLVVEF